MASPTASRQSARAAERLATVPLVTDAAAEGRVRAVFDDIKATKGIDFVPRIWQVLASHPEHLELCWSRLKVIMAPGQIDVRTKEIIALAVSATNGCRYCVNSHTRALQKLGLTTEMLGEVLAVVGLFNQMNSLVEGYQIEPDILPEPPEDPSPAPAKTPSKKRKGAGPTARRL